MDSRIESYAPVELSREFKGQLYGGDAASAFTAGPPVKRCPLIDTPAILLSPAPIVWFKALTGRG